MSDPLLHAFDPVLMGIINVTPDSFSDGGEFLESGKAIAHGLRLKQEGAQILDIGGESTRPGAKPITIDEELARVLPVIEGLKNSGAMISIDTRHARVMKAAVEAGAGMVNDVSALTHDPAAMAFVAEAGVHVCLMHMKGDPRTMQDEPTYNDVFAEVFAHLESRMEVCVKAGVKQGRIMIDPGIGFGKNLEHNLILLNRIGEFKSLGVPVLLGASRKSFIERVVPAATKGHRLPGSIAACLAGYERGIRHFRVHDVAETAQALSVFKAIG